MRFPRGLLVLVCLFALSVAATRATGEPSTTVRHPNFVLILTDDQRWDTIGRCMGTFDATDLSAGRGACMPYLQKDLIAAGITFLRGYVTTSLCCPSRTSILTGRYAHHVGVWTNRLGFALFDDSSTIATWLHTAGYRSGLFGKYLNGYGPLATSADYVPPGWDSWHALWGRFDYESFTLAESDPGRPPALKSYSVSGSPSSHACDRHNGYMTDQLCSQARTFLAANTRRPFFLYFAPYSPHLPATPAARWKGFDDSVLTPRYPSYDTVPTPNTPSWLPTTPLSKAGQDTLSAEFRDQLDANRAVDDAIDALVAQLAGDGRLSDTVFIFLSDNGLAMGEHRLTGKSCEFEECAHVPFVIACPPAVCPGSAPGTIDASHAVLNIDLAPTIAALAGVRPSTPVDGMSLVPLLNGSSAPWRSSFYIEDVTTHARTLVGTVADVGGHTYKYVQLENGDRELYDLTVDPFELANLVDPRIHQTIQHHLAASLGHVTPPSISITSALTPSTNATFTWASSEPADFECSLDQLALSSCGSGSAGSASFTGLEAGRHVFVVRGTDRDGNIGGLTVVVFSVAI